MNLTEKYMSRANTNRGLNKKYAKTIDNIDKNSGVIIHSKNLNNEIEQYSGNEGETSKNKVFSFVEENKQCKTQNIREPQKDLCQHCLTKQIQRLCWGTHHDGHTGWGSFCLECEPYPYDLYPGMLRKGYE